MKSAKTRSLKEEIRLVGTALAVFLVLLPITLFARESGLSGPWFIYAATSLAMSIYVPWKLWSLRSRPHFWVVLLVWFFTHLAVFALYVAAEFPVLYWVLLIPVEYKLMDFVLLSILERGTPDPIDDSGIL